MLIPTGKSIPDLKINHFSNVFLCLLYDGAVIEPNIDMSCFQWSARLKCLDTLLSAWFVRSSFSWLLFSTFLEYSPSRLLSFTDVEFIATGAFDTIYKTGRCARKPLFICEDERVVGRLTREISPSD